jgi:hypothetical protein
MPYLVRKQTTAMDSEGESQNYFPGQVVSDWELSDHIKKQISTGIHWYTQTFEPLTDREAKKYRVEATTAEGARIAPNGQTVDPPFEDYVGLHPKEIIDRMKKLKFDEVEQVRQYERGGLNRNTVIEFVAPSEREPFNGYDAMSVRDILEKMEILDDDSVNGVIVYEMNHARRPAVIEFEREATEVSEIANEVDINSEGEAAVVA